MVFNPESSLAEGEVGGKPVKVPQDHQNGTDTVGRIKIGKIIEVRISRDNADAAVGKAMQVCKAMFEKWKESDPNAKTPIHCSQHSKDAPSAPVVEDHRPPASKVAER